MAAKKSPSRAGRTILVGTASWSDPGFVEHWYPKKMPAGDRLAWYAQHFEMVEVNSTFYAAPDPRMVERWCRNTPDGFTFDEIHQLLSRHSTKGKLIESFNLHRLRRVGPPGNDRDGRSSRLPSLSSSSTVDVPSDPRRKVLSMAWRTV